MDDGAHNSLLFLSEKETDSDFFLSCACTRLHIKKKRLTTLVEFVVCRLEREREGGNGKAFFVKKIGQMMS